MKIILQFSLLLIIYIEIHAESITRPVFTENCEVIGTKYIVNDRKVYSFKGIPFAKPPIGDLRFQPTEPANNWYETYNATFYRPACWQPLPPLSGVPALSEDCLYLNIWTPTLNKSANLSVMIFIYGGGLFLGSGSQSIRLNFNFYDPTYLSLRNVVVITFNYRLSIFGFLYGNSSDAPGNAGIWDQVIALNWTRRNIANFGGNPNDITLFGQSSGSTSNTILMVSNITYGIRYWFKKVILLSGSSVLRIRTPEQSYEVGREIARNQFKCINDRTWINCLKCIPPKILIGSDLSYQFVAIYGDKLRLIPFNPNIAVKQGYFRKDIIVLMNHKEIEGALFGLQLDIRRGLGGRYTYFVAKPQNISKIIVKNDILNELFVNCSFNKQVAQAFVMTFTDIDVQLNPQPIRRSVAYALGDYVVICPMILFASYITNLPSFSGKVFQSRLTYQTKPSFMRSVWSFSTHGDDLPLDFGHPFYLTIFSREYIYISNKIMDLYTHFAKTGDVMLLNPTVYNDWPQYCVNNGVVNASYIELHPDFNRLGKVFVNQYRGNDGYFPNNIYNCFNFWEQYILNNDNCI